MPADSPDDFGKRAAAWLATCFVVAGGLMTCLVLSFTLFDDPRRPVLFTLGGAALLGLFLWVFRDRPKNDVSTRLVGWLFRRADSAQPKVAYRVTRREASPPPAASGQNAPPSVERLREIADDSRTWVPSDHRLQRA